MAMDQLITIIGYGEVGRAFVRATGARADGWQSRARVFDLLDFGQLYAKHDVHGCASLIEALHGSKQVISVVTADQALIAAENTAANMVSGALFFDMNSVAPDTKRAAANAVEAAGGRYVDVAIMSPINPAGLAAPLLISGPHAEDAETALKALGFSNVRSVGHEIGIASTVKMLRSVMYKGVEALTAECLIACQKAGVTAEVLASFGNGWAEEADYRLDRMMVHGTRRSAEMAEAVKTLESLGVEPLMTRGTVARQAALGALDIDLPPEELDAKLEAIAQ